MKPRIASTLAGAAACIAGLSANIAGAGVQYVPERVTSIAAVSNSVLDPDVSFRSGLFVAYSEAGEGRISYYRDSTETLRYGELEETTINFYFDDPTAIAELDGNLVVWDDAYGILEHINLRTGRRQVISEAYEEIYPSQLAISPDGLVFVVDEDAGRIFWTTLEGGDLRWLPFKTQGTSIAFLTWDTLAVLDRADQSVTILHFRFDGDEIEIFESDTLSLVEKQRSQSGDFRSLVAQDGALYLADSNRIFSYVPASDELVLAVDFDAGLQDIRQVQVSTDSFYVIDGEEFRRIDRTIPIEVVFDSVPYVSQLALLELYYYLENSRVLDSRDAIAARGFDSLEEFLLDEAVFIASTKAFPRRTRRGGFLWLSARDIPPTEVFEEQYEKFEQVFCKLNVEICANAGIDSVFLLPVPSGTLVRVPNVRLESRLGVREFELSGASASAYLDALIVSEDLRERANETLLRRLNKNTCGSGRSSCLEQRRGSIVLPYQTWSLTTAVLSPDFYAEYSALDAVTDYAGVELYSQQVFTKQQAYGHHLEVPPGAPLNTACNALSAKHEAWFNSIKYPQTYDRFIESTPRVGIVEHNVTKDHQVFELTANSPSWYEYDPNTIDLVAKPAPASIVGSNQEVLDSEIYTRTLHHGTHVSAIVGGRRGHCWSGLLPEARLVHIDSSSAATIRAGVFRAHSGFVRVVNISQRLSNSPSFKNILVDDSDFSEILFVLAAGNDSVDFNGTSDNSAVDWGDEENIVVVSAVDETQQIIPPRLVGGVEQKGANSGKRVVDLAAPGWQIYSATEDRKYGPATGTSQAAPAVAAAAAYLIDEDVGWAKSPGHVKARLIATADWHSGLVDKVWGGMLNLEDAVRFPDKNLVRTFTNGSDTVIDIGLSAKAKLDILNFPADIYDREEDDLKYVEQSIRLNLILSLKRNADGTYRVVFRDRKHANNRLRILLRADLSGTIRCKDAMKWTDGATAWQADSTCDNPLDIKQVTHFYRAVTYDVDW